MRKILILFTFLAFATSTLAQLTDTVNYIYRKKCLTEDCNRNIETVKYYNGLGKLKQIIDIKANPFANDIVTHFEYDSFGRQAKDFLPVPQENTKNGGIYQTPLLNATQIDIYGIEKIYAEKEYDNSPLERVTKQISTGNDWSTHPKEFIYSSNKVEDYVKNYKTSTAWDNINKLYTSSITSSLYYSPNELYKTSYKDEDGNEKIIFKNLLGQTILVRKVLNATTNIDTYYVYNEYDLLTFVISPTASIKSSLDQSILDNLCYQYKYDNRKRLVEKKFPGKDWEFMVYDQQDRLVLSQDGLLRGVTNNFSKKGWLFKKYDDFGRVVYTGFFANTASRLSMQTALNNMAANALNNERRSSSPFTLNGMDVFYTKEAFPTGSMTILSVYYYDQYQSYNFNPVFPNFIFGKSVRKDNYSSTDNVNGKNILLMKFVKNIEDDNWTKDYTWYDEKERIIGTHSINHLGGYTKTETELNFIGLVKQTKTFHKRLASDTEKIILETFEYDNQNRLLSHKHKVDNQPEEPLSLLSYNKIGQLSNKKVGKSDDGNPLQSIDYKYNIKGALTYINDPSNMGNDLFAMKFKYQNPEDIDYGIAKFNGSISEIDWKTTSQGTDDTYRRYAYKYDKLNRLTDGIYLTPGVTSNTQNHYYDENVSYDLNGNIMTLNRFSKPNTGGANIPLHIDELVYDYDANNNSNKLIKITDNIPNASGYPGGGNTISYDLNGNMTSFQDRGISKISYNYLNLPNSFEAFFGKGNYKFRADGIKIYRKDFYSIPNITTETDYLDGFHYEGGALKFAPTSEGFYNFASNQYIYNYTDHLGSTRFTYAAADGGGIQIMEQNNYYPFGLRLMGIDDYTNLLNLNIPYTFKFNGKESEWGGYDYGARMYMPDVGRFLSYDPMAEYTHDPYGYVWNDPVNFSDPTGMVGMSLDSNASFFAAPDRPGFTDNEVWIDNDGVFVWDSKSELWKRESDKASFISGVNLIGKAKPKTDFSKKYGPWLAAGVFTSEIGVGELIFLGVIIVATIDMATTVSTHTTIADPGAGYRSLNTEGDSESEAQAQEDTNGVSVPKDSVNEQQDSAPEAQNRKGGGKNAQHKNLKAKQSAKEKYEEAKAEYERLKSKPNKTKEDIKARDAAEKQMKHWQKKAQETGENHSRNAKGNR